MINCGLRMNVDINPATTVCISHGSMTEFKGFLMQLSG
jgi:hypothetical protein